MAQSYPAGSAPWEIDSTPQSFKAGQAPWETGASTTPAAPKQPASSGDGFFKSLLSAPVTELARPVQAIQAVGHRIATAGDIKTNQNQLNELQSRMDNLVPLLHSASTSGNKVQADSFKQQLQELQDQFKTTMDKQNGILNWQPFHGGLVAPAPQSFADLPKEVGRAAQTVALGVDAPVAAGALFGAGTGLEEGKGVGGVLGNAALGAVGGKLLSKIAPPALNLLSKPIPQGVLDLGSKLGGKISDFAANHELPGVVQSTAKAINRGGNAFEGGLSNLFKNSASGGKGILANAYPNALGGDTFQKDLSNAAKSIYPNLTKGEKAGINLTDKKTIFGIKSVPDLVNTPGYKQVIEATANLPEDIKIKPSDSPALMDSKISQGVNRMHQDTDGYLAQPTVKAQSAFNDATFDKYVKENFLNKIGKEFGQDSPEYTAALRATNTGKNLIKSNDAHGVYQARQDFNGQFKIENPRAYARAKGSPFLDQHTSATVEAGREYAHMLNDFVESRLPANSPYRARLKEESSLLRAQEEIGKRQTGNIEKSAGERMLNRHPVVKGAAKTLGSIFKMGTAFDVANHL